MNFDPREATVDTVRRLGAEVSNWGRWGPQDQLGSLNHVRPDHRVAAAQLIRSGEVVSLTIPVDSGGPQHATSGRPNPIHVMTVDGRDFTAPGTAERDAQRGYLQNADDLLILPTQAGTQWDGLAHVFFEQKMYNGYSAAQVTSSGARRNAISEAKAHISGRGVLLDLPLALGLDALPPGHAITDRDLDVAAEAHGVQVGTGDFVLIRTGAISTVRARGAWADYAGGDAPGLGMSTARWFANREVAAVATDTWDVEVRPTETIDVAQPVHVLLIVFMGMWIGEIFDLEELATRCTARASHEFFFCAPPLAVTGGIGSPINPQVIL